MEKVYEGYIKLFHRTKKHILILDGKKTVANLAIEAQNYITKWLIKEELYE